MTRQGRPTIRDVATAAGVAVSTVSNVLNDHPHVTESTRRKVLDAVDQLGYQASRAAKSLPGGRTHLIAYCLPGDEQPNPALDVFLHRIVATAAASSLEMLLFAQQGADPIEPYRDLIRRGGADGFVLSGIDYDDQRVEFLQDRNIPFVCFGRVGDPDVAAVDVDGAAGTAAAVDHLAATGRSRLAFVGWPDGSATGDDRLQGYLHGAEQIGVASVSVKQVRNDYDIGRKLVADLVEDHNPDAIVCVSDVLALGVMDGLRALDIRPGADVSVTGFDDVPASSLTSPGLTTLRQPMDRIGSLLVERLVSQLGRSTRVGGAVGASEAGTVLIEPDLIIRQSTRNPPLAADT